MKTINKIYSKFFDTEISTFESILLSVAAVLIVVSVAYRLNEIFS